ncbi:HAD family hydrolase [Leptospira interrogans]|uniref:Dehalogenase-like hydrolase n=17 Tax=Leptospira interrogans TaxID=173 RepID=Q8F635_LEPIN|nr:MULTISPECIES: HAD family hydrolase [Leptospira]APH42095.1 Dehalogenase [Leptospira interrogans serovar Copenhageni/Icterohaemorrhagiae]EMF44639.1 haloacid dehalogenase-like hydrolase [Leptospira interrogans serovar Lora str. TE 1992]EMF70706.1 haloacid dehalogenase-like hydrolase [Leptospira interrogans serovar Canicola str. LT1962]EMM81599.1 haloacid dehalogenase-like hydrolase [Leptospira interrogans str. 2006001854]EMM96245.1 haloacid dehalogenase-like hydrolase [Leptospira interrogans s
MSGVLFAFDLMDTLIKDPFHSALYKMLPNESREKFIQGRERNAFIEFEKGQIEEDEFLERFYLPEYRNGGLPDPKKIKDFMFSKIRLIPETVEIVKLLKANGNKIVLASNYSVWYKELQKFTEMQEVFSQFDQLYFSCELGVRKPAEEYFQWIQTDYPGMRYVLIDDNATNVEAAGYIGWDTFQFDPKKPSQLGEFFRDQFPNYL